uniref:Replication initiator 1 n=1 Tax=Homo sapiens TaxID=9606 RepID=C9J7D4_HUMAN
MDGRRVPAQPAAEVRPGQGRGATAGPRGAAPPAGRVTVRLASLQSEV